MFLMYADESGDTGMVGSPTRYFVLSGLVIHELSWMPCLDRIIAFRKRMRDAFGLRMRDEIHASRLISRPGELVRIQRNNRLSILRFFARELAAMPDISIVNVVVDKLGKHRNYDVFSSAWVALVQRFENTIAHRNFPGPRNADDRGMIFPDHGDDRRIMSQLRKMRRYNPVPNQPQYGAGYRNLTLSGVIEDPVFKDSADSYFTQACDVVAYLLHQNLAPCGYMRKSAADRYFLILEPLGCTRRGW